MKKAFSTLTGRRWNGECVKQEREAAVCRPEVAGHAWRPPFTVGKRCVCGRRRLRADAAK